MALQLILVVGVQRHPEGADIGLGAGVLDVVAREQESMLIVVWPQANFDVAARHMVGCVVVQE